MPFIGIVILLIIVIIVIAVVSPDTTQRLVNIVTFKNVDAQVSEWSEWTKCEDAALNNSSDSSDLNTSSDSSATFMNRTRTVLVPALNDGITPPLSETVQCGVYKGVDYLIDEMPVDCKQSNWSEFNTSGCPTGNKIQTRTTLIEPKNGGQACGVSTNSVKCVPQNETYSEWSAWSECVGNISSDIGTFTRTRTVLKPSVDGGSKLPAIESQKCVIKDGKQYILGTQPIDCEQSEWSTFNESSCPAGNKVRTRTTKVNPANGGAACGVLSESIKCVPVNATYSAWSDWSNCNASGKMTRTRVMLSPPREGGLTGPITETVFIFCYFLGQTRTLLDCFTLF